VTSSTLLLAASNVHCKAQTFSNSGRILITFVQEMHALVESVDSCLAVSNTFTPLLLLLRTKPKIKQGDAVVKVDLQLGSFLPLLHMSTPDKYMCRDSRKSRQKMVKKTANFCENRKKQKSRQRHGIKSRAQRPLYSL